MWMIEQTDWDKLHSIAVEAHRLWCLALGLPEPEDDGLLCRYPSYLSAPDADGEHYRLFFRPEHERDLQSPIVVCFGRHWTDKIVFDLLVEKLICEKINPAFVTQAKAPRWEAHTIYDTKNHLLDCPHSRRETDKIAEKILAGTCSFEDIEHIRAWHQFRDALVPSLDTTPLVYDLYRIPGGRLFSDEELIESVFFGHFPYAWDDTELYGGCSKETLERAIHLIEDAKRLHSRHECWRIWSEDSNFASRGEVIQAFRDFGLEDEIKALVRGVPLDDIIA